MSISLGKVRSSPHAISSVSKMVRFSYGPWLGLGFGLGLVLGLGLGLGFGLELGLGLGLGSP